MDQNNVTREEFVDFRTDIRETLREMKADYRLALKEHIEPLVERMDRQNGRVGTLELLASANKAEKTLIRWLLGVGWTFLASILLAWFTGQL